MAFYRFGAEGRRYGVKSRIEFEFDDDTLKRCYHDGQEIPLEIAVMIFKLDREHAPGYIYSGKPGTRLNALNFLQWDAFDRTPEIFGDPGEFDISDDDTPEGAVN